MKKFKPTKKELLCFMLVCAVCIPAYLFFKSVRDEMKDEVIAQEALVDRPHSENVSNQFGLSHYLDDNGTLNIYTHPNEVLMMAEGFNKLISLHTLRTIANELGLLLEIDEDSRYVIMTSSTRERKIDERQLYGMWIEGEGHEDGFQFLPSNTYGPYAFTRYFWDQKDVAALGFYEVIAGDDGDILILWYREEITGEESEFINVRQDWKIEWQGDYLKLTSGEREMILSRTMALEEVID